MPHASGRGTPPKYYPLQQCLAAQPGDTITLTFTQIEQIIDAPLPPTAYLRTWWANRIGQRGDSQTRAWQSAGWRVQAVNMRMCTVTFTRLDRRRPHGRTDHRTAISGRLAPRHPCSAPGRARNGLQVTGEVGVGGRGACWWP